MDDSERTDPELRRLSLIDFSSENDTLIDHQSTENQNNDISSGLLEDVDAEKAVDTADFSGQMEQLPQSSEPLASETTRKTGRCNLRKSLAWDTAFFTSAGVLDHDELSSMIKGVDKGKHLLPGIDELSSMIKGADKGRKHFLPGIEEDIRRSTDSISTLGSESMALESLEADLFEDVRASIQKSNKASNMASSNKAASGKTESKAISSLKNVDLASKNMMMPKPASKKQTIGMQGPGKLIKQSSGCSQGTQPVARNGGLTSSLPKAPKVISKFNPVLPAPLKKASLGAKQVKMENDKAKGASVPGKEAQVSKTPGLGGSSRTVPKPAPSSKSSSSSSSIATKKVPPRSSSSCDSSCSASSATVGISAVKSNRKKIVSRIVNPTSSSSVLKTPSKVALKRKGQSSLSASLMSSKLSSNTSPASSISEWSSVSSSSTSTANQRSNTSRASFDTNSSCISLDIDAPPALDHHNQSNGQISDVQENKVTRLPSETLKSASMQNGTLSQPATGKPSALRMPSPKIGFFDGVKPGGGTPNRNMQSYSGIPAGPKIAAGISSKTKLAKLQPARTVTAIGNMKLNSQKRASPVTSPKPSNASTKVFSVSGAVKKCHSISPQVQNETDGESCLKAEEVGPKGPDRADDVPDSGLDAEKTSLGVLKSEITFEQGNTNLKDMKITPIERDTCALISHCNAENIKLSNKVGEDAISSLQHLNNNLHSIYKSNEKENAQFEVQVDGLSMHVGAVDSKQELEKELIGNSITQIDFSHPDSVAPELSSSKEFFVPGQKVGSLSNLSGSIPISLSPVTSEIMYSTRTPFAAKNSFCNSEGDLSTRLSTVVVEKTASFPSLESAQMENS